MKFILTANGPNFLSYLVHTRTHGHIADYKRAWQSELHALRGGYYRIRL